MLKVLLKDSSYYLLGSIFAQIVGLLFVVAAMRTLPVAEFGVYSYALAFVTLFAFIADGGLSTYLIKEIAQNEETGQAIYRKIQALQLVLSIVILTVLAITAVLIHGHDSHEFSIIVLLGLGAIINGYISPIFSSLIARGHREIILKKDIAISLVRLIYLITFLTNGPSLLFFASTNLVCALCAVALCLVIKRRAGFSYLFRQDFDGAGLRKILSDGLPYSTLMLANILYNKIDVLMLKYISGEVEVAVYSGATQFVYPFMFVSTVLVNSIFPRLSRNTRNHSTFNQVLKSGTIIMSGVGFAMSAGLFVSTELFFHILFGDKYALSIPIFQVLVWYLFIVFSYGAISNAIVARGGVTMVLKLTAMMLVLNVLLNALLIKHFGAVGAAISTLVCELMTLIGVTIMWFRFSGAKHAM